MHKKIKEPKFWQDYCLFFSLAVYNEVLMIPRADSPEFTPENIKPLDSGKASSHSKNLTLVNSLENKFKEGQTRVRKFRANHPTLAKGGDLAVEVGERAILGLPKTAINILHAATHPEETQKKIQNLNRNDVVKAATSIGAGLAGTAVMGALVVGGPISVATVAVAVSILAIGVGGKAIIAGMEAKKNIDENPERADLPSFGQAALESLPGSLKDAVCGFAGGVLWGSILGGISNAIGGGEAVHNRISLGRDAIFPGNILEGPTTK